MSRSFKVTKSVSVDLTPDVAEPEQKKVLVMAYSYFTSRKRVPGGMSKEAKEALKGKPRDSEYRIDGVVTTAKQIADYVAAISAESEAGKPWTWLADSADSDRQFIYSNAMSTQSQAAKWWTARLAKVQKSFAEFLAGPDVLQEDQTPDGTMRWLKEGYSLLSGPADTVTLEQIVEAGLAAEQPVYFELVTSKPLSGSKKKA